MDTADIGLPAAGAGVAADVERLAREIVDARLRIRPNCAARTVIADIEPIVGDLAARRDADRGGGLHRVEPDPAVRRGLDGRSPRADDRARRWRSPSREGLPIVLVTEDTTRADPESLRRIYARGDPCRRASRVHRRHGRARDAGRGGRRRALRRRHRRGVRRRHRHRLARSSRSRHGGRQHAGGDRRRRDARARHGARHRRARAATRRSTCCS